MTKSATVILPDQLFENNPSLSKDREVILIEHKKHFTDFKYHKKKLVLHRASMKAYEQKLKEQGYKTKYIEFNNANNYKSDEKIEDLGFLTSREEIKEFFNGKNKMAFTPFYIEQRKRLKILVKKQNKPVGGKWSFDPQNRQKIPEGTELPKLKAYGQNEFVKEAKDYVNKNFPDNPGETNGFIYPVMHSGVKTWLKDFLENRISLFGDYEDAIQKDESFLFHSVLSFALNTGLLTPQEVVEETLSFAEENPVSINSLEGFIRQVTGWREYIRAVYLLKEKEERETNFFGFEKPLPEMFYTGKTGVEPVDNVIKRLLDNAYTHHIERLMVLGNFMLLCEISPHEVYKWFMEMYIDAYDWVMVPNVYGMSQFADGGLIMTKPYISSSNYILKMSNFEKNDWCDIWDALYWRFIENHREYFEKNPRASLMVRVLDKKSPEKVKQYCELADKFLSGF